MCSSSGIFNAIAACAKAVSHPSAPPVITNEGLILDSLSVASTINLFDTSLLNPPSFI